MLKQRIVLFLATSLAFAAAPANATKVNADPPGQAPSATSGHQDADTTVRLTPNQIKQAGIRVMPLEPSELDGQLVAPGEVKRNLYRTTQVSPRAAAQVVARHRRLGETVKIGDPLVTLSSVQLAEAQGALLVADREWARLQRLGRDTFGEQRYVQAQANRQQALARVRAFGMTEPQIRALLRDGNETRADGTFQLVAPQTGIVMHDEFALGQYVEPGRLLMEISDPTRPWVEARIDATDAERIAEGADAEVDTGERRLQARVVKLHPALDQITRTVGVRLEVRDPEGVLRPGRFVTARIDSVEVGEVLALPVAAVLRDRDGEWVAFVQRAPGTFAQRKVRVLRTIGEVAVIEGLSSGTPVVADGAFFLQSELAKGGFEAH